MREVERMETFAERIRREGIRHAVLLGMGGQQPRAGSSAHVLRPSRGQTGTHRPGFYIAFAHTLRLAAHRFRAYALHRVIQIWHDDRDQHAVQIFQGDNRSRHWRGGRGQPIRRSNRRRNPAGLPRRTRRLSTCIQKSTPYGRTVLHAQLLRLTTLSHRRIRHSDTAGTRRAYPVLMRR